MHLFRNLRKIALVNNIAKIIISIFHFFLPHTLFIILILLQIIALSILIVTNFLTQYTKVPILKQDAVRPPEIREELKKLYESALQTIR